MTEEEARGWVADRYGVAVEQKLACLCKMVATETAHQNLIAPSTTATIWNRHVVDSAQLLYLAPDLLVHDHWIDIGSGAGFPGLVIAVLADCAVTLVEPRRRRAAFLEQAVEALGLKAKVACSRIENVQAEASVISARAVAPIATLFDWAKGVATPETRWILPKGHTAREDVVIAQQAWQGVFHVKQSITDLESMIVVASGVARR